MKLLAYIDADTGRFKTLRFACGHTLTYASRYHFRPDELYCEWPLCRYSDPRHEGVKLPRYYPLPKRDRRPRR